MSEHLCLIEFWFNRYQTLFAAIIAIGGVVWALRPAWRQVELLSQQNREIRRSRIVSYYDTLSAAIRVLDGDDWPETVAHPSRDATVSQEQFLAAYDARETALKALVERLATIPLNAKDRATVSAALGNMEKAFKGARGFLSLPGERDLTEVWFNLIDRPDTMVRVQRRDARAALDEARGLLVAQLS